MWRGAAPSKKAGPHSAQRKPRHGAPADALPKAAAAAQASRARSDREQGAILHSSSNPQSLSRPTTLGGAMWAAAIIRTPTWQRACSKARYSCLWYVCQPRERRAMLATMNRKNLNAKTLVGGRTTRCPSATHHWQPQCARRFRHTTTRTSCWASPRSSLRRRLQLTHRPEHATSPMPPAGTELLVNASRRSAPCERTRASANWAPSQNRQQGLRAERDRARPHPNAKAAVYNRASTTNAPPLAL